MASFNHCVFLGRIDRTPDLSRSSFGRLVARFPLVIEQDGTEILRLSIVARGNLAEIVTQNAHQGREVLVQGRLHLRHLTEEQTGVRHPLLDLVASTVLVLSDSACHAAQEASSEKNSHAFPTGGNEHA